MITLSLAKALGRFGLDIDLTLGEGVTALFGPSGSGKTTILNMIAGLVRPDRGHIKIDDQILFDSKQRINVPTHHRAIGYVFQDARLFPHMSVAANLDYGRFMSGHRGALEETGRIVALLELGPFLARRPANLSGGEAARVAIGRALLARPRLLLLDEPLASLDQERKQEILPYLERLAANAHIPMIYVSHAEAEVERLAQRIVRIEAGRLRDVAER